MDWIKTFNRGQWAIHGFFILGLLATTGIAVYALRLNHIQATEEERTSKINSLLEGFRKDNTFEKLGRYLSWAESKKAHDKIRDFSGKLAQTEELLEIKVSEDVGLALRTFNKLISNNSGISDPTDVLKVLTQKVNQLRSVGESQNYRTVTALSTRMQQRLSQLNAKNVGSSVQVSYLKSDLQRLEQVVKASSLTDGEKTALLDRFNNMAPEIELLSNLNTHARDMKAHVEQATTAFTAWLDDADKKASDFKGNLARKQSMLVVMLGGLVGLFLTAWMGLLYMFRWQKKRMADQVEGEVRGVIEKGILADQRFMVEHYSENTRNDIIKLIDDLKVKLNLGTMLHEGLPFAGCLLDSSFKLTWFNHLFLEQFYLSEDEVRSEAFNWDYLREYLNLDQDPVYDALVNKIAGIYPVKIKQDELSPMQPYEMYVTPITVNREDRVMVFFYPLVSVKEAIVEQVKVAKEVLTRFVDLWDEGRLDEDELRLLEKDFTNNDLPDLFHRLSDLQERIENEKKECLHTIADLERENIEHLAVIEDLRKIEEKRSEIIRNEFKLADQLKLSFLHTLERGEALMNINRSVLQQNDELKTEAQRLLQASLEATKKGKETSEIMLQLESVRTDYKKLKLELLEVKARLISINSSLMGQLPPLDEHQQKLSMRYKDELARLDFNVATLDKKLSQLDVLLSKLQMMNERTKHEQTNFNFGTSQKDHAVRETLVEIQRALSTEEGKIIDHFTQLNRLMRDDLSKSNEAQRAALPTSEQLLS